MSVLSSRHLPLLRQYLISKFSRLLQNCHPIWETLELHFTEDSSHGPLNVKRVHRLRHFVVEKDNGGIDIAYKPDFPITGELVGVEEFGKLTIEQLEDRERLIWKEGGHEFMDMRRGLPESLLRLL